MPPATLTRMPVGLLRLGPGRFARQHQRAVAVFAAARGADIGEDLAFHALLAGVLDRHDEIGAFVLGLEIGGVGDAARERALGGLGGRLGLPVSPWARRLRRRRGAGRDDRGRERGPGKAAENRHGRPPLLVLPLGRAGRPKGSRQPGKELCRRALTLHPTSGMTRAPTSQSTPRECRADPSASAAPSPALACSPPGRSRRRRASSNTRGPILDYETAQRAENRGNRYLFEVSKHRTIDGTPRRNLARYANHSCNPNSEPVIWRGRVFITSLRAIKPGEEIVYDYGIDYLRNVIGLSNCKCSRCRGGGQSARANCGRRKNGARRGWRASGGRSERPRPSARPPYPHGPRHARHRLHAGGDGRVRGLAGDVEMAGGRLSRHRGAAVPRRRLARHLLGS